MHWSFSLIVGNREEGAVMTPEEMFASLTAENKEIFIRQIETLITEQEVRLQSPDSSE